MYEFFVSFAQFVLAGFVTVVLGLFLVSVVSDITDAIADFLED